jgi:predicted  nucleic acid-binding Zn-ribbon protein
MRCHSLQERFEDQSATLKLARKSHGDMQVTFGLYTLPLHIFFITLRSAWSQQRQGLRWELLFSEGLSLLVCYKVKSEAETGKLRQQVFAVQERNVLLQKSVDEYRRQLENQQELVTAMRNEYEKRLKDERDGGHSRIQALQERMLQADMERAQAVKKADELRDSLTTAQSELTTLREQVQNIQTSMSEWSNQVRDLTMRNHALQAENATLLERGINIGARYDTNNLVGF